VRVLLSPLVYLANNFLSLTGVVLVTTAGILWIFLLPTSLRGTDNPYLGILLVMGLPGLFFTGLALIPAGIAWKRAKLRKQGADLISAGAFPPLRWQSPELRRLVSFVLATTVANLIIGSHLTYQTVTYMDSVAFCGTTCHTVMQPEYTAYQNSPHARVECTKCHIGPGASWFVRSKLSGAWQVVATTLQIYPTPIPTPIANLRPARETCETCHWPQKFGGERLRVVTHYAGDEANTRTQTVMMLRISGMGTRRGIHDSHFGEGVAIRYSHTDDLRQEIPWVEYTGPDGTRAYRASGASDEPQGPVRLMDCMDCHTRPSHAFELAERAMTRAMEEGHIPEDLPYAYKTGLEVLKAEYTSHDDAAQRLPEAWAAFYRENHPSVYAARKQDIDRAGQVVLAQYQRNVFPAMKVEWGTYPNQIGHTDFPGCFRCHDDDHTEPGGRVIAQDCSACHTLLATDEPAPKIMQDLGLIAEK
jgi:hypothetical protein